MTAKKPLFEWTDREREIMGEENEGFGERLDVALDQEHTRTLQFSSVSICPVRSCPPGKSAKSHIPISRRIIKGRPFILRPLIRMCGRSGRISDTPEAQVGLYRRTDNSCAIRRSPSDVLVSPLIE